MKTATLIQTVSAIALFSATIGCADAPARRVETGGPETIRTIDQIDDQDWSEAATKLTNSMLSTPNLLMPNPDGTKCVLHVSRIINNTTQVVDTDLLVKTITVTLHQSGKVVTQTRDANAKTQSDVNSFLNDKQAAQPTYQLSGKLIETQASAGSIHQATFYFQLSLTDQGGNDVWEGQQPITKIGSHNSVGI